MIHNLYKQRGETPLERIHRFRDDKPEFKNQKFTYLGRLDPMAEGLLLVASGEDVKRKEEFLGLDKEYEFTSLFGFATDTYDCLGKIVRVEKLQSLDENEVRRVAGVYEGEREQKYPPFSSKTVNFSQELSLPKVLGSPLRDSTRLFSEKVPSKKIKKPLFQVALDGEIDGVEIPSKNINIYKMEFLGLQTLSPKELFGRLLMDISKVKGDFRQNEILITWKKVIEGIASKDTKNNTQNNTEPKIFLGNFKASVSTGTYIRGIVNDLGNTLGIGACALSIKRTKLGEYKVEDSEK